MAKKINWDKLTPAEQRVEIAKDVIAQLRTGKIIATPGLYLDHRDYKSTILELADHKEHKKVEMQEVIKEIFECDVCAKGAIFICDILNKNKYKISNEKLEQGKYDDLIDKRLKSNWSLKQLDLIETAFEGEIVKSRFIKTREDRISFNKAVYFSKIHGITDDDLAAYSTDEGFDPEERLIAIMENIIENKGEFIP